MKLFRFRRPDPEAPDTEDLPGDEALVKRGFLRKVKRVAARLTFADRFVASYYCALDPRTPLRAKAILMAALAYFVVPTDLIPDFLIGFGFTDDISVLIAALSAVSPHIKDEHRAKAREALDLPPEPEA